MLRDKHNVLQAFKMSGKPQWKLYYNVTKAKDSAPIAESDPTGDAGTNEQRLSDFLDMVQPGKYLVQFKSGLADNAGFVQEFFEIPGAVNAPAAIGSMQQMAGMYTPDTFNQILDAKIGAIQKDFELQLLRKDVEKERAELEELRKSNNAFNSFVDKYGGLIVNVLALKFGAQPAGPQVGMAGFSGTQQQPVFNQQPPFNHAPANNQQPATDTGNTEDTQRKLDEVLQWLVATQGDTHKGVDFLYSLKAKCDADPDLLKLLTAVVNGSVPTEKIEMLKQFLNS